MGLFDCRCAITGVSLKGAETTLVPLLRHAGGHAPAALPIHGQYDRLGSIDGIREDLNTRLILDYFREQLRAGRFVVDPEQLPIHDIEALLRGFERNLNDDPATACLDGEPVLFALVADAVWSQLAHAASKDATEPAWYRRTPLPAAIYAAQQHKLREAIAQLGAVDAFLAARGLAWQPSDDPGQHYAEEMRAYLDEARQRYADMPGMLDALRRYEEEVGELLRDDD